MRKGGVEARCKGISSGVMLPVGMVAEGLETVMIPWYIRNTGQPPQTIRPTDLFVERLSLFSADLQANPHPWNNPPTMT